jgi:phytoene dehydrogenase-like protein
MATGALLARRGLKVLVAESRPRPGGRASFVERDGFVLDYGIHGHRFAGDGAAAAAYREMGESLDLIEPSGGVILHRGRIYPVPERPSGFIRTRLLGAADKLSLGRALLAVACRKPDGLYKRTVSELLPRGTSKEARFFVSVLAGTGLIAPDIEKTSAGEFSWFLRRAARAGRPLAFPRGGCRQHVERLGSVIRESGELRTGVTVEKVLTEKGSASGVETSGGRIRSEAVVTAVPLTRVAGLLEKDALGGGLASRMKSVRPTAGVSWDVALSKPVTDAHSASCTEPLVVGAFSSNIDPSLCPRGRQLSTWCMPLPPRVFDSYEQLERRERLLQATVFRMFARMEENVLWERMLRLSVIDGAAPEADQPWTERPAPGASGVEGLFFAGDSVGVPGQGGDIAFSSAVRCAREVASYLG